MSPAAVVWIAFAGNGNVRFWTADEGRAKDEKAHGMDLRAFTLPELVALISASRSPSETEIVRQAQMAAVKEFAASLVTYLDPIDDTIDKQTYSAKIAADFDLPDDAEHEITLTAKLERSFCAAVNKTSRGIASLAANNVSGRLTCRPYRSARRFGFLRGMTAKRGRAIRATAAFSFTHTLRTFGRLAASRANAMHMMFGAR